MSRIIAGRFEQQSVVQQAREEILRAGFSEEQVSTFYVNPPGQHDLYKIGGDREESPGTERTEGGLAKGGIAGGIIGGAIGAVTSPFLGPIGLVAGALVGAHVGDLAGSLNQMADDGRGADGNPTPTRHAGMVLAVATDDPVLEERAIEVLRVLNAQDIECTQGTITDGDWKDFDPLMPPLLVEHRAR